MIRCPRDGNTMVKYIKAPRPASHCKICTGIFIKTLPINEYKSSGNMKPREEWDVDVFCPEDGEKWLQ